MPEPTEVFNKLLDKHTLDRLKAEDSSALRFYQILNKSREEMYNKLLAMEARFSDAKERFSYIHLVQVMADVSQTMARMEQEVTQEFRARMLAGYDAGQEQTYLELQAMQPAQFPPGFRPVTPQTPILNLIESQSDVLKEMSKRLGVHVGNELRRITPNISDAEALRAAGAGVEKVKDAIARGIVKGEGTASIARRLMHPVDGEFPRLANNTIVRTVRLAINESYNAGHDESIRQSAAKVPELQRKWFSALVRSTRICIDLHGQTCGVGEAFKIQGKEIARPPAIGQGLKPSYHLCRSRVVPFSEAWPHNPKLDPLTEEEKEHFTKGGGRTTKQQGQGPKPKSNIAEAKAKLEERVSQLKAKTSEAKAKRGRPKGSKNKPKTPIDIIKAEISKGINGERDAVRIGGLVRAEADRRIGERKSHAIKRVDDLKAKIAELEPEFEKHWNRRPNETLEQVRERRRSARADKDHPIAVFEALEDEYSKAVREKNRIAHVPTHYLEVLSEIRPMGGQITWGPGSDKDVMGSIDKGIRYLPAAWIQASNARPDTLHAYRTDVNPLHPNLSKRAVHADKKRHGVSESQVRLYPPQGDLYNEHTGLHEFTHRAEECIPKITQLEDEFLTRRAGSDQLTEIYAGSGEVGYKNHFTDHYIGKYYSGSPAREIMTMGVEGVFYGKHGIDPQSDPDLMDFVLGVIASV